MGWFTESDEEKLARRIKNIENMDKSIKFHQWFIPFCIFILLPISLTIIIIVTHKWTTQDLYNLGIGLGLGLGGLGVYILLLRFGVISRCSW